MTVQNQIEALIAPAGRIGGLPIDTAMLGIALRTGTEGGKRFRPWLLDTVHRELAGQTPIDPARQSTLDRIGAAIELLHTAFVIHDDVIDHDDTRRGRTSVPGWFRESASSTSASFPLAGAILTGDLALAAAVRGMATCGASAHVTEELLDLLDATLHDSAAGELADVRLTQAVAMPDVSEALAVAELKTAAYSFVLPMRAAAVVAEASDAVTEQVSELGRALGVAFQLRDDLLGTFGDPARGTDQLSDLREGKRTALVVHAAQGGQWLRIRQLLGDPGLDEAGAAQIRRALVDAGSVEFVENLIARHLRRARRLAEPLGLVAAVLDPLTSSWHEQFPTAQSMDVA